MNDFTVEHADLDSFAVQLGRAVEDLQAFKTYLDRNSDIKVGDQGLLNLFLTTHTALVQQAGEAITKTETILRSCRGELTATAGYYRETDEKTASNLDSTYPQSKR